MIVARQKRPVEGWGSVEHVVWINTGENIVRVEWENPDEVDLDNVVYDGLAIYELDQLDDLIAEYESRGFVTE